MPDPFASPSPSVGFAIDHEGACWGACTACGTSIRIGVKPDGTEQIRCAGCQKAERRSAFANTTGSFTYPESAETRRTLAAAKAEWEKARQVIVEAQAAKERYEKALSGRLVQVQAIYPARFSIESGRPPVDVFEIGPGKYQAVIELDRESVAQWPPPGDGMERFMTYLKEQVPELAPQLLTLPPGVHLTMVKLEATEIPADLQKVTYDFPDDLPPSGSSPEQEWAEKIFRTEKMRKSRGT